MSGFSSSFDPFEGVFGFETSREKRPIPREIAVGFEEVHSWHGDHDPDFPYTPDTSTLEADGWHRHADPGFFASDDVL